MRASHSQPIKLIKPAQQKRSKAKAQRMLNTGHSLIEEKGYEGMRIADIAALSSCSVGSFYERFNDKDTFFRLLLQHNVRHSKASIKLFLKPDRWKNTPLDTLIQKVVESIIHWFQQHKGLYTSALSNPLSGGNNYTPFREPFIVMAQCLVTLLENRKQELECKNIESSVWFAVQMMNSTLALAAFSAKQLQLAPRSSADKNISIDDPLLAQQLTRVTCLYLGINQSEQQANYD